jgi:hypothetical protein
MILARTDSLPGPASVVASAHGSDARYATVPTPMKAAAAVHIEHGSWLDQSVSAVRSRPVRTRASALISAWAIGEPSTTWEPVGGSDAWFRPSAKTAPRASTSALSQLQIRGA